MKRLVITVVATFAVVATIAWLLSRPITLTDDGSVTALVQSTGSNTRTVRLQLNVPDREDRYVVERVADLPKAVFHAHLADRVDDEASGSSVPLTLRPIPALTPTFYVPESAVRGETLTLDEKGGAPAEYRVLTVADFDAEQSVARVLFGLYFGVLLAVGVYQVLMFAVLGGLDYLAYGLYMGALLLQEIARTSYIDLLFYNTSIDRHLAYMISVALLTAAGYAFFNTFLRLAKKQTGLNRIFLGFVAVDIIAALAAAWRGESRLDAAVALLTLATLAVGLIGASRAIAAGERPARFLLLAYCGFLVGLAATAAAHYFPSVPQVMSVGFEAGTAFEALTLALGVAESIAEEQRSLTSAYARFVPEAFLRMLGKPDVRDVKLGDRTSRRTTVLFTDVRAFSMLSETMAPEETFTFVNKLLSATGPIIRAHGGIVDKYIGDAIMALFPGGVGDALEAALALQQAIVRLNAEREREGKHPIAMGIGVHVGDVVLGTVGETARMDGTAIGDAVNLASRLEGLTKIYGCSILLSDDAASEVGESARAHLRYLGRVAVSGKNVPIGLFENLAADSLEQAEEKRRTEPLFATGVNALMRGEFALAAQCLDSVLTDNPMDGPATHLAERARELELRPGSWIGFDRATEK